MQCCWFPEPEFLYNKAADSGDTDAIVWPGRDFSTEHQTESKAGPDRANFRETPVKHGDTTWSMNPEGTPLPILKPLNLY